MSSEERKLNVHFHNFLGSLSRDELDNFIVQCLGIPTSDVQQLSPQLQEFFRIPSGKEIDELITFGNKMAIAIELKDKWKTNPGQLETYFQYVQSTSQNPFLVFLSQSPDDIRHPNLSKLFQNQNWRHRTWYSVSRWLDTTESHRTKSAELRAFLSTQGLDVEKSRTIKEYGLDAPLPDSYRITLDQLTAAHFKNNKPLLCWNSREEFWRDVISNIETQLQTSNFFSYRWDIYHYMWRWAFFERNVFFDMTDDNKWEYYIDYYESNIKGRTDSVQVVKMRKWYDQFLKIGKNQFIELGNRLVGVISINGNDCYFACGKSTGSIELSCQRLWREIPW
jgi:hypothetical protein